MIKNLATILAAACLLAGLSDVAQAACESCGYADRGDRFEGVESGEEVSGGSFKLHAVHYLRPGEAAAKGGQMHLYFRLPEAGKLEEIRVAQPDTLYRMEPKRKEYPQGLQSFTWPRGEVIDPLGLSVDGLYALLRTGGVYIPALVSTRAPAAPSGGYAFVFKSGAGIDADCTVSGADGAEVKSFECFEDYGGMIPIEWDGTDEAGKPAADGVYTFEIEGDMLAETIRPLAHTVSFRHQSLK
ncbi:MAG: hypothetical protein GY719_17255 [bacterium]|nr:hypothetical protein [bacterium]